MNNNNIVMRYEDDIFNKYMKMHPNADPNKVRQIIIKTTEDRLRDIPCKLHNNITHEWLDSSVLNMFDWIEVRKPIMTGNGTFFRQHAEYLAPEVQMLEALGARRDGLKKEMLSLTKGTNEYANKNVGQGSVKVIMNAEYGGSGATSSPFFNIYIPPATTGTAKNLTTTLICCLEYLTGNNDKWAKNNNMNELMDCINIILNDTEDRDLIDDYYSPEDVCKWLISRTNNVSMSDVKQLMNYLNTLTNKELCKLMLAFNIHLVLQKYLSDAVGRIISYLKANKLDIENMSLESINASGYGKKMPEAIADDILYVSKVICDNCVYAYLINDAEIRCNWMSRKIVCVTDTDSLMVHFPAYLESFQCMDVAAHNFRDACIIASAFGMRLFIEHIMPKYVKYWAVNCGIEDEYYQKKFVFKNEFGFLSMALIAKKMYAASMFVQEGAIRDPHDIAVTGLSFKKRDAAEFLEPIMIKLYDKYILTPDKIDVEAIYNEYCALRHKICSEMIHSTEYFKVQSFQDPNGYDPNKILPDQIRGSLVWNNIITDEEILAPDRVKVICLSFDLLKKYKDTDPKISELLRLNLIDSPDEKHAPVICLPEHYKEVPDWISPVIDIEFTADKLLSPFKQLMSLFDFYLADTRGGMIPSRMLCL